MSHINPALIYEYWCPKDAMSMPCFIKYVKSIMCVKKVIVITKIEKEFHRIVLSHEEKILGGYGGQPIAEFTGKEATIDEERQIKVKYHYAIECYDELCLRLVYDMKANVPCQWNRDPDLVELPIMLK